MTEQLPPEEQNVFVCCDDNTMKVWSRVKDNPDEIFWEDSHGFWWEKDEVIAWMDLPDPPENTK